MKKIKFLLLPLAALILALLPWGAVCNFATPDETVRKTYSYFSLIPYGYANFAPLLCGIMICILLALCVVHTLTGKKILRRIAIAQTFVTFLLSIAPLLYGIRYYSVTGALISAVLMAELLLLCKSGKKTSG